MRNRRSSARFEIWRNAYGDRDVRTAKGLANLGAFYIEHDELEKAAPLFTQAKAAFESAGLTDRFVLHFLDMDALLERRLGHKKEAKTLEAQRARLETSSAAQTVAFGLLDASASSDGTR